MIFTSTEHALEVGRACNQKDIEQFAKARAHLLIISHLFIRENQTDWAFQTLAQAQFQREAIEAHERMI